MEEKKSTQENEELICSVCKTSLQESETVKKEEMVFCIDCWNKKVVKERNTLSVYAFFVVFILFQLCFFILPVVYDTRGFPSLLFVVLCVVIGTLSGMIAYEEVYARMSRKMVNHEKMTKTETRNQNRSKTSFLPSL